MSRALDPETVESLQKSNLQTVYNDIASALSTKSSELLEIEFLPKSHPLPGGCNVLIEGNNIAVPKVKLVQAFIVARQVFFKCLREDKAKDKELRDATAVMLLLDPEHLTAANTRKRLILKYENGPGSEFEELLRNELWFVDGYLTSRLHRHTKSPTLWSHRRWILEKFKGLKVEHDVLQDLRSVVLIAAERHPRNYYAWSHIRWLVQSFHNLPTRTADGPMSVSGYSTMTSVVKDWCLKNPSDTSGFSFLLYCLFNLGPSSASARTDICSTVCADILRLAVAFKWTHESVWVFLRTVVASNVCPEPARIEFFQAIETISIARPDGQIVLKAAKEWYQRNQQNLER
ncbi:protein prenylyltransferase [Cadophora sp. DSE1049]|nr:protein prenylyltransferase [Cadophora sp. DSE1049]